MKKLSLKQLSTEVMMRSKKSFCEGSGLHLSGFSLSVSHGELMTPKSDSQIYLLQDISLERLKPENHLIESFDSDI